MRKKLVFGGEKLNDPQYTWFYSALTRGMVHGHPGDEALILTKAEADALKDRVYADLPRDLRSWTGKHSAHFSTFAGKKLILESEAQGYVIRKQAHIEDANTEPEEVLGMKQDNAGDEERAPGGK